MMWAMFLRRNRRTVDGETYEYWTLCKTVRTARGPRQEVVAHLGKEPGLDSGTRHGWEEVADLLEGGNAAPRQGRLGEQLPRARPRPQWAHVDLRGVRVERVREFGRVYLALSLWRRLGLHSLLAGLITPGMEAVPWELTACILTVARFCGQKSELEVAERWYADSALEDLLGVPFPRVNDARLYRGPDCKQVNIGLERHARGTADRLRSLCRQHRRRDHGPGNSRVDGEKIRQAQTHLGAGPRDGERGEHRLPARTRRALHRGHAQDSAQGLRGKVAGARGLERSPALVAHPDGSPEEQYVLCRSSARREKELDMLEGQRLRLRAQLDKTHASLVRRPAKEPGKIERRIGRWLGRFPVAERLLEVEVERDAKGRACGLKITERSERSAWAAHVHGAYLLRTNCTEQDPAKLWRWYIQLCQAEEAFRISKSDLSLHPVFHQKTERVEAHILVCFLSLALWRTLEMWMRGKGLGDCARQLIKEIATVRSMDVVLPVRELDSDATRELRLRIVARPDRPVAELLHRLGLELPSTPKIVQNVVEKTAT